MSLALVNFENQKSFASVLKEGRNWRLLIIATNQPTNHWFSMLTCQICSWSCRTYPVNELVWYSVGRTFVTTWWLLSTPVSHNYPRYRIRLCIKPLTQERNNAMAQASVIKIAVFTTVPMNNWCLNHDHSSTSRMVIWSPLRSAVIFLLLKNHEQKIDHCSHRSHTVMERCFERGQFSGLL